MAHKNGPKILTSWELFLFTTVFEDNFCLTCSSFGEYQHVKTLTSFLAQFWGIFDSSFAAAYTFSSFFVECYNYVWCGICCSLAFFLLRVGSSHTVKFQLSLRFGGWCDLAENHQEKEGIEATKKTERVLWGERRFFVFSSQNCFGGCCISVPPAAGKPLYEAQNSDFLRGKDTGLRKLLHNWRNCANFFLAQIQCMRRRKRQICAKKVKIKRPRFFCKPDVYTLTRAVGLQTTRTD